MSFLLGKMQFQFIPHLWKCALLHTRCIIEHEDCVKEGPSTFKGRWEANGLENSECCSTMMILISCKTRWTAQSPSNEGKRELISEPCQRCSSGDHIETHIQLIEFWKHKHCARSGILLYGKKTAIILLKTLLSVLTRNANILDQDFKGL